MFAEEVLHFCRFYIIIRLFGLPVAGFFYGGYRAMKLLYWFESIRAPWLDALMMGISQLGGEILFMAIVIALFWCMDKRKGYYLMTVGFVGIIANQFLKLACRISRPWVQDPEFTIVEAARSGATGYSFPSGHTQNAAAVLGCPARMVKKKAIKITLWVLYALVAISRMYLGVHTPYDVGVGIVMGLVLVFALYPVFSEKNYQPKRMYAMLLGMLVLSMAFTAYTRLYPFPQDIELDNLNHGIKNGYTLTGAVLGMLAAFWLDQHYVHFDTKGSLPAQIVKCVAGLALLLGIKTVLKAPLNALTGGDPIAHTIRYAIVVFFAAGVWPMAFPWITRKLPGKKA